MRSGSKTFLILGTGSTSAGFNISINGEVYEPPMDSNFFTAKGVTKLYNEEDFPALHFFQSLNNGHKSLEQTWSDIDLASKLTNDQISKQRVISMVHDYKILEKPFQIKAQNNSEFKNNLNSQLAWVGEDGCIGPLASWEAVELILKVLSDLKQKENLSLLEVLKYITTNTDLKGIATFNYDNSIEKTWDCLPVAEKLYYYDPAHSSGYVKGVPLYKMHGSINWKSIFDGQKEPRLRWSYKIPENINENSVYQKFNQGSFTDNIPDYIEEPTIIPPDLFKQNITLDIQNDAKSILFKKIWNRVWKNLNEVDILIFIGFSFPKTDHHARLLFSTADRRKPFDKIIVNLQHKGSSNWGNYESVFEKIEKLSGGTQGIVNEKDRFIKLLLNR